MAFNHRGNLRFRDDLLIDGRWVPEQLTTTQRDALSPSTGERIYNVTTGQHEYWTGGTWEAESGGVRYALVRTTGMTLAFGANVDHVWDGTHVLSGGASVASDTLTLPEGTGWWRVECQVTASSFSNVNDFLNFELVDGANAAYTPQGAGNVTARSSAINSGSSSNVANAMIDTSSGAVDIKVRGESTSTATVTTFANATWLAAHGI